MNIIGIIPARFDSTRFPGKPLHIIDGITLLQRVFLQAKNSKSITALYIATDDTKIYEHALTFTNNVVMSTGNHESGTSRCIEVFEKINTHHTYDGFINIQGDEPFISPDLIDKLAASISPNYIITAKFESDDIESFNNPNTVKVVCNKNGDALYFSRSPIPFGAAKYFKHIGIYGFHTSIVNNIKCMNEKISNSENLEQLQWLSNYIVIKTITTTSESYGVDTPSDVEKILQMLNVKNV